MPLASRRFGSSRSVGTQRIAVLEEEPHLVGSETASGLDEVGSALDRPPERSRSTPPFDPSVIPSA